GQGALQLACRDDAAIAAVFIDDRQRFDLGAAESGDRLRATSGHRLRHDSTRSRHVYHEVIEIYREVIYSASMMPRRSDDWVAPQALTYGFLGDLRSQIRRFLRVRETAARAAGVEPQQYLLLLQVKGLEGRQPATIGALAERLQLRHHSVVQLVNRLV